MLDSDQDLVAIAKDFVLALETRNSPEDILRFYHPDVTQTEYPNALVRTPLNRNLKELAEASIKGKDLLKSETFDILRSYQFENTVIIEAIWTGVVKGQVGAIPPGGEMKAYFAQFFEFQDGLIIRQRNYDCFMPF